MTRVRTLPGPDYPLPVVSDLDAGERVPDQEFLQKAIESLKISGGSLLRNLIS